jgi:hypothetical protein
MTFSKEPNDEESEVFVNVTKEAILEAPQYHVPPLSQMR